GVDGGVQVWDAGTGQLLKAYPHFPQDVAVGLFDPEKAEVLITGRRGNALRSERRPRPLTEAPVATAGARESLRFVGKTEGAISLTYSPNGLLLATGHDNPGAALRLWNTTTGKGVWEFPGQPSACASVAFSEDGKQARGTWDGQSSQAWDVRSHRLGEGLS